MIQMRAQYATAGIEGRKRSSSRFVVPQQPRSKLFRRLHTVVVVVPIVNSRFGIRSHRHINSSVHPQEAIDQVETDDFSGDIVAARICPAVTNSNAVITAVLEETQKQNTRAVKQALQLLFSNEHLGLSAYTQAVIPVLYLCYMPVLQALPNHVYYPTHYRYFGDAKEFNERMTVIGTLAMLQFAGLTALQVFVSKRFGVSTIYQAAFVLETQFVFLQGRLLIWLIFAVQSTLVHYGTLHSQLLPH